MSDRTEWWTSAARVARASLPDRGEWIGSRLSLPAIGIGGCRGQVSGPCPTLRRVHHTRAAAERLATS